MATATTNKEPQTDGQSKRKVEESLIVYTYSPVFYWWPVWLVGFAFALATYFDSQHSVWTAGDAAAVEETRIESDSEANESSEKPNQTQVRMSHHKVYGFIFAVVLLFVYLHSNVLWRGFRAYFFLAAGVAVLLLIALIHTLFPDWGLWAWVKYIVYQAPDIYISMDGYLFLSSLIFAIWLFVVFVYNRWTYMKFEAGQVRIVEEIGEGESVYDTTNMTFEKQKEDLFRHHILGLGFLRPLAYILPGSLARGVAAMTGTGDLVVRIGGENGRVIVWPNVLNIDNKLERITTFIKSRRVVSQ